MSGRRVGGLVHVVDAVEETRALKSTSSSVLDERLRRRALLQDGDDEPEGCESKAERFAPGERDQNEL